MSSTLFNGVPPKKSWVVNVTHQLYSVVTEADVVVAKRKAKRLRATMTPKDVANYRDECAWFEERQTAWRYKKRFPNIFPGHYKRILAMPAYELELLKKDAKHPVGTMSLGPYQSREAADASVAGRRPFGRFAVLPEGTQYDEATDGQWSEA